MKYHLLASFLLFISCVQCISDEFTEELLIRPLADGKLHAHFQFTIRTNNTNGNHFDLFPHSIGQTVEKFEVNEFHLSFTQGRWFNDRWGFPIISAPIGAELWTWFAPTNNSEDNNSEDTSQRVSRLWKGLTFTLAGLFCASLEDMKDTVTSTPHYSFYPEGHSNFFGGRNPETEGLVKYSTLPREAVCTENLTPWLKILPCKSKSGLAGLVNSLKLYAVDYHSMATHYRLICTNSSQCHNPTIELAQTLSLVFDPTRRGSNNDWSLQSLFGRDGVSLCPAASMSNIYVQTIAQNDKFSDHITLQPSPQNFIELGSNTLAVYNLNQLASNSITNQLNTTKYPSVPLFSLKGVANGKQVIAEKKYERPSFRGDRYVTGWGHEFGGLNTVFENFGNESLTITYHDIIPWWLKVYFHTIKLSINQTQIASPVKEFSKFQLIPCEDRSIPNVIEFTIEVAAHTSVEFSIEFDKAFLHWTEHPPDAHRGFDLGSAVISVNFPTTYQLDFIGLEWSPILYSNHTRNNQAIRFYTQGHLIQLATPDFSMPYNVITLTGTVFALLFGSMLNIVIRRMRFLDRVNNEFVSRKPLARIFRKLLEIVDENVEHEDNNNPNTIHTHND